MGGSPSDWHRDDRPAESSFDKSAGFALAGIIRTRLRFFHIAATGSRAPLA
jgi:hypothetical protein